jgi:hypothetical protein
VTAFDFDKWKKGASNNSAARLFHFASLAEVPEL